MHKHTGTIRHKRKQLKLSFLNYEMDRELARMVSPRTHAGREMARRWQQAVFAFPAIKGHIKEFKHAIENGLSLYDEISQRFSASAAAVKTISKAHINLDELKCGNTSKILTWLTDTPPNWHPKNQIDWEDFVKSHAALDQISRGTLFTKQRLVQKCGGEWEKISERLAGVSAAQFMAPIERAYRELIVPKILEVIYQAGFAPDALTTKRLLNIFPFGIAQNLATTVYRNKGPFGMLESLKAGAHYHPSLPGGAKAYEYLKTFSGWLPLISPIKSHDGLMFSGLPDPLSLVQEGLAMDHCIGSLHMQARYKPWHPISVHSEAGLKISTLAIEWSEKRGYCEAAHFGPSNSTPCRDALQAAQWLINELNLGRVGLPILELTSALRFRRQRDGWTDPASDVLGFPWQSTQIQEWMFLAWHSCRLSKADRALDLSSWLKSTGLVDLIRQAGARSIQSIKSGPKSL
jgi:hypothetical protein